MERLNTQALTESLAEHTLQLLQNKGVSVIKNVKELSFGISREVQFVEYEEFTQRGRGVWICSFGGDILKELPRLCQKPINQVDETLTARQQLEVYLKDRRRRSHYGGGAHFSIQRGIITDSHIRLPGVSLGRILYDHNGWRDNLSLEENIFLSILNDRFET